MPVLLRSFPGPIARSKTFLGLILFVRLHNNFEYLFQPLTMCYPCHVSTCSIYTAPQNGRGWKGPLEIIQSNPPAKALSVKARLGGALSNPIYWKMSLPMARGWTRWSLKVCSNPNHCIILSGTSFFWYGEWWTSAFHNSLFVLFLKVIWNEQIWITQVKKTNVSQHPECQKWCVCAHKHLTRAGEGSRGSKSTHTYPDNHSGGKKKKIAFYQTEIKWISATAEWLGNSIHFNVVRAVIPIFVQRHWASQEQLEKVFNIFCIFYMYFFPLKWYCCMLAGIIQTSRLPLVFCLYILFTGRAGSNPCV